MIYARYRHIRDQGTCTAHILAVIRRIVFSSDDMSRRPTGSLLVKQALICSGPISPGKKYDAYHRGDKIPRLLCRTGRSRPLLVW